MTSNELRQKYLDFFKQKGHAIIPSASLIPENDPSVLFTMAGMHPIVPFLLGAKHPAGTRLVDSQKCIRTGDIDDVGDNRHLTFFEMLGNWSLGDYFKKEAIEWSFEFLTSKEYLGLDPKRLFVTVYRGEGEVPADEESMAIWKEQFAKVGIDAEVSLDGVWKNENTRIFALGNDDNWWGLATGGPCGPCTEMFYDVSPERGLEIGKTHEELVKGARFVEVWNDVFMQYLKSPEGAMSKLEQTNVDTGMGLERTISVINGFKNVFEIDIFQTLFAKIEELSGKKYSDNEKAFRIIADHLRAGTFILGDEKGIEPSNVDQGYVLRRLIRRAIRYGKQIGISGVFTFKVAEVVINEMGDAYPELRKNKEFIINQLVREEEKFAETLENGLREFDKLAQKNLLNGHEAFILFSSYGFPWEMTVELASEKGIAISKEEFDAEFAKHQELSRAGAEQKFKGGLADTSVETCRLHTATHLLQAALRKILGEHVHQKGSNITVERLRFDFTHPEKVTPEQLKQAEDMVNDWIKQDIQVVCEELPYDEAVKRGAMGLFTDKYGQVVKVYTIAGASCEMCGGPHAAHTGELGHFKIQKEEASSAGVRRIKAILE